MFGPATCGTFTTVCSRIWAAPITSRNQRRLLARRAAVLEAELVHLEDWIGSERMAGRAPAHDVLDLYSRLASGQRRHLEAVGLDRVARDITLSLAEYLEQKQAQDDAAASSVEDLVEDLVEEVAV